MKLIVTFGEMLDNCYDWDDLCDELGLNPWLINEGLASSDDEYELDYDVAVKHGIVGI
jgi:hypothetical protein|tara:strand:- start:661 stop:834 length:174 start_codon:yes stop_codon:yes gene_type:complete